MKIEEGVSSYLETSVPSKKGRRGSVPFCVRLGMCPLAHFLCSLDHLLQWSTAWCFREGLSGNIQDLSSQRKTGSGARMRVKTQIDSRKYTRALVLTSCLVPLAAETFPIFLVIMQIFFLRMVRASSSVSSQYQAPWLLVAWLTLYSATLESF